MTRGTNAVVTTPSRSTSDARPVWLFDIATGGVPANLRLTTWDESVTWDSSVFTPWPFDVSEIAIEQQSETANVTVVCGDADGVLSGYIESGMFRGGQEAKLIRTDFAATGGAGAYAIRDDYFLESWERVVGGVRFVLRPLLSVFSVEVPLMTVSRTQFPGLPPSDFA